MSQKCYEMKQYKKSLGLVKEILKKFPDHGGKQLIVIDIVTIRFGLMLKLTSSFFL